LLAGPIDLMEEAVVERHRLGGAMRQAGILAAAGLVALDTMVERLADDHRRASTLAAAVAERWPDSGIDVTKVQTNIVVWSHPEPAVLLDHLSAAGVLGGTVAPGRIRLVTHADVDDAGIDLARKALRSAPI
jgi:threonine aldolase